MASDIIGRIAKLRRFLAEYDQPGLAPADVVEETLEKIRRLEVEACYVQRARQVSSLAEYQQRFE